MSKTRFEWDKNKDAEKVSYVSSVPATGGKARQFMSAKADNAKAKIKYTDEPLGDVAVVRDFLPPPEQLAFREEGVKVTLALSKKSIDFFKSEAAKHHTQYQRMIRRLVDAYVENYTVTPASRLPRTARKQG